METKIGIMSENGSLWGKNRYKKLKELGFSCVDVSIPDTNHPYYQCEEKELIQLVGPEKRLAEEAGIEISQIHGPWRCPPMDAIVEQRTERMEKMKRALHIASLLGCKYCVVHPIMPMGREEAGTPAAEQTWEMNIAFFKELLKSAREYDVTVCLENMPFPRFSMATPREVLRFVKAVSDPYLKICLDTGHVAVHEGLCVGEEVRALGDYIKVLHVHDNNGKSDQHNIPFLGSGKIDWKDFGQALKDIGFRGAFSYETKISDHIPENSLEQLLSLHVTMAKEICGE